MSTAYARGDSAGESGTSPSPSGSEPVENEAEAADLAADVFDALGHSLAPNFVGMASQYLSDDTPQPYEGIEVESVVVVDPEEHRKIQEGSAAARLKLEAELAVRASVKKFRRTLVVVPLALALLLFVLILGMCLIYLLPFWDPLSRLPTLRVAFVNADEGVRLGPNTTLNLGEKFYGGLLASHRIHVVRLENKSEDWLRDAVIRNDYWTAVYVPPTVSKVFAMNYFMGTNKSASYTNQIFLFEDSAKNSPATTYLDRIYSAVFNAIVLALKVAMYDGTLPNRSPLAPVKMQIAPLTNTVVNLHAVPHYGWYAASYMSFLYLWTATVMSMVVMFQVFNRQTKGMRLSTPAIIAARYVSVAAMLLIITGVYVGVLRGFNYPALHGYTAMWGLFLLQCFCWMGIYSTFVAWMGPVGQLLSVLMLYAMLVSSDGIYPTDLFSQGWRNARDVLPMGPAVVLLRFLSQGTLPTMVGRHVGVILAWGFGTNIIGIIGMVLGVGEKEMKRPKSKSAIEMCADASVVGLGTSWGKSWDPSSSPVVHPAEAGTVMQLWADIRLSRPSDSVPACSTKIVFRDGSERVAHSTTTWSTPQSAYVHAADAELADHFGLAPAENVTVVTTCTDSSDNQGTTQRTTLTLGSCADSAGSERLVAQCIESSVTNRACAQCGDRCVPYPVPKDQQLPATCTRCGDGLITFGENCESSIYCNKVCSCSAGSAAVNGKCVATAALGTILVRSDSPVTYAWAMDTLRSVSENCFQKLSAVVDYDISKAVLVQRQDTPEIKFRVWEKHGVLPNTSTPFASAVRAVDSACVLRCSDTEITWGVGISALHCGDGVVSDGEQCDSTDYCDLKTCTCNEGSVAAGGRCVPRTWFVGFELLGVQPVDLNRATALVSKIESKCFEYDEVRLQSVATSASGTVVRAEVVPVAKPMPGARTPMAAVKEAKQRSWCIGVVLANEAMQKFEVAESSDPACITGFGPGPAPESGSHNPSKASNGSEESKCSESEDESAPVPPGPADSSKGSNSRHSHSSQPTPPAQSSDSFQAGNAVQLLPAFALAAEVALHAL
eukprot:m51a1_g9333 hypothetical protein (1061) ;mRNA; r:25282-29712